MRRIVTDTRLPDSSPVPGASWDYGADVDWLKGMRDAWVNDFDWKAVEKQMNTLPQFIVVIEFLTLHFVHQRSSRPDAILIILFHGWPTKSAIAVNLVCLLTFSQAYSGSFIKSSGF